jgi:hypothetical protein
MAVMEMEDMAMDATVEGPREKLRMIVEKNGEAILQDPDRVEGLLRDHCGSYRKEISALVGALHERVPVELKGSWQSAMSPEAMRARMVKRMEDNRGLAPEIAAWAVDTWSHALGIGLGRRSDRLDSVVLDDDKRQEKKEGGDGGFGGGVIDKERRDAERRRAVESDRAGGAAAVGLLAKVEKNKKTAGVGVGALALVAVAAVIALTHKPTPPPPQPDHNQPVAVVVPPPPVPEKKDPVKDTDMTPVVVSVGTQISIRLNQGIDSEQVAPGETFAATLAAPVILGGKTVLPVGSDATIRVVSIDHGKKFTGQTTMQLALNQLSSGGKTYKVSAIYDVLGPKQAAVATQRGAVGGAIGAVGGFIGGKILHHPGAGTAAGAGAGAGVGVATTKTQPAKAKAEQLIQFRLSKPMIVGS